MIKRVMLVFLTLILAVFMSSGCLKNPDISYRFIAFAVDQESNIHIVWFSPPPLGGNSDDFYGTFYRKIDKNGNNLVACVNIRGGVHGVGVASDLEGNAHVFTISRFRHAIIDFNGELIKSEVVVDDQAVRIERVAIDSEDNIHCVYLAEVRGKGYFKLDGNGSLLVEPTSLNEVSPLLGVDVVEVQERYYFMGSWGAVDANNNIHEIWYTDAANIEGTLSYRKISSDGTVVVNTTYKSSGTRVPLSFVHADSNGNLHVVWKSYGNIYYMKLDNNGTFLFSEDISEGWIPPKGAGGVAATLDSKDNIHVIWRGESNGEEKICYAELDANGTILMRKVIVSPPGSINFFMWLFIGVSITIIAVAVVVYLKHKRIKSRISK